jgi:hypothetical protein
VKGVDGSLSADKPIDRLFRVIPFNEYLTIPLRLPSWAWILSDERPINLISAESMPLKESK